MTTNQCDGCQQGLPIDRNWNHWELAEDGKSYAQLFGCTKHLYETGNLETMQPQCLEDQ